MRIAVLVCLVLGCGGTPRAADGTRLDGQLRGTIHDDSGRALPNVTIDASGHTATSGDDGTFTLDLPPGRYQVTFTATGYAPRKTQVVVEANVVVFSNPQLLQAP